MSANFTVVWNDGERHAAVNGLTHTSNVNPRRKNITVEAKDAGLKCLVYSVEKNLSAVFGVRVLGVRVTKDTLFSRFFDCANRSESKGTPCTT